ncbi:MAG TPA: efflux RND transporter periplasmic adaptor subunit [Candidatus Binataceae bacterium]|nr:efflux RND transporter periplasmic adaptor subunit [Candidatus Binataceae bacterium]
MENPSAGRGHHSTPKPGRGFFIGWIVVVVAVAIATASLVRARATWIIRQSGQLARQADLGPRVLVTKVRSSPRWRTIELPAAVHGYVETPVYAKVAGYLKSIRVDKGDRVKSGEILAILESPETDQQVANARATYKLDLLTDRRNQVLLQAGVVAPQTADQSHQALLSAQAQLRQMLALQSYEVIRAPFSGMITARYVDPGALIPQVTGPSSGSTPIVSMATLDRLRIYAYVPQSDAPFIRDGDPAVVTVAQFPRRKFGGAVTRHPEALDSTSVTMLVEVDVANPDRILYPGMYARVRFTITTPVQLPLVPDDALIFKNGDPYVPVVREGRLHLVPVSLSNDNGIDVEIPSGITVGELVAVNVGQAAADGEPVQPVLAQNGQR